MLRPTIYKVTVTILAVLAFLVAFCVLATPVSAAVFPDAKPPPPSVEFPTEDGPMVKVVGVTEFSVTLWGFCPTAHETYYVGFVPTDGSAPGRYLVKEFATPVHRGFARINRLLPDTEYRFTVKAIAGPEGPGRSTLASYRWMHIGSVKVTTLPAAVDPAPLPGGEVTCSDLTSEGAMVAWVAESSFRRFKLVFSALDEDGFLPPTKVFYCDSPMAIRKGHYLVTGLTAGHTFRVRVFGEANHRFFEVGWEDFTTVGED